jgi:steroid 5-alpha reductase family enzyme
MNSLEALGLLWGLAIGVMCGGWLWQRRRRNAGIADVLWSALLAVCAVLLAANGTGARSARVLLALLGGGWALRLAIHLAVRVGHEEEDGRYRALRARWAGDQRRWFGFFQFQALSVPLFALPFVAVAANRDPRPGALAAGAMLWLLGVLGEALADRQLARFRAAPEHRGRTCRSGLWRYSRHPNYFFEWLHWFAYVAWSVGSPLAPLAWLGPITMYVFLRYLSGVPWTEAQALRSRGEDYRDYQRRTSIFFPWFPGRSPSGVQR